MWPGLGLGHRWRGSRVLSPNHFTRGLTRVSDRRATGSVLVTPGSIGASWVLCFPGPICLLPLQCQLPGVCVCPDDLPPSRSSPWAWDTAGPVPGEDSGPLVGMKREPASPFPSAPCGAHGEPEHKVTFSAGLAISLPPSCSCSRLAFPSGPPRPPHVPISGKEGATPLVT